MTDPFIRWFCILWLASLLMGIMVGLVFGCAPLPTPTLTEECITIGADGDQPFQVCRPAPAVVEPARDAIQQVVTAQEIARDQANQADEFSPWLAWLILGGAFLMAFLWAIRAWPWNRSWRTHG